LALNRLNHGRLKRGQVLAVKASVPNKSGTGHKVAKTSGKTRYLVHRGETLASIARKFNVATDDIQRWNNLSSDRITPGHKLTIYKPDAA
jgi:membrane-bound lytic murein transglycosylase D